MSFPCLCQLNTTLVLYASVAEPLNSVLAAQRRRLGLSQVELAARLGRPQSVISRWESRDRALTPGDLGDVAAALELDVDDLLSSEVPRDRRRRSSRARPRGERTRVGRNIAVARLQRAGDPVVVAKSVGISPYRLWRIERGVDMTLFEFAGICRALGAKPSVVLGHPGDADESTRPRVASDRIR